MTLQLSVSIGWQFRRHRHSCLRHWTPLMRVACHAAPCHLQLLVRACHCPSLTCVLLIAVLPCELKQEAGQAARILGSQSAQKQCLQLQPDLTPSQLQL